MKMKLAALAAFTAICSSCLPVPFDLALSQGAALAQKMTRDNPALLTMSQGFDPSTHDFVFFPSVALSGFDYSDGFLLSQRDLDLNLSLVQYNASSETYDSFSQQARTVANPDPHAPPYLAWPTKIGPSFITAFIFDALDPLGGNSNHVFWGDPVAHTTTQVNIGDPPFTNMKEQLFGDFGTNVVVHGASISADPNVAFDMVHWLGNQLGAPGLYSEFSYQVRSTFPGLASPQWLRGATSYDLTLLGIPIPGTLTRCTYFYDDNQFLDPARFPNRAFASWWDGGSWVSYAWWGPPGLPPTNSMRLRADHRLDALLSTGQLLSTEDGTGRLYDRDGDLLATFPLGNLVYIGEEYVGGVPRCYFSQALVYDHTVHFNVYWIRTDQLSTLGN